MIEAYKGYSVQPLEGEQWLVKIDYVATRTAPVSTATVLVGVHDVTVKDLGRPYRATKAEQERVYDLMGAARRYARRYIFEGVTGRTF